MKTVDACWPAAGAGALTTTRRGGFDLALHPDEPAAGKRNRQRLCDEAGVDAIQWMNQQHGVDVFEAGAGTVDTVPAVDAAWTTETGIALGVLTADCAPLLLHGRDRRVELVAAAHCGWRGTVAGIVEATLESLPVAPGHLTAWIGPTICERCYEVDTPVRDRLSEAERAAVLRPGREDHWWMDLSALVALRLRQAGVRDVAAAGLCTSHDARFFSHRSQRDSGRMATLVWRKPG